MGGEEPADEGSGADDAEYPSLPVDLAFEVLAKRRSRYLCYVLYERSGTIAIDRAAAYIAAIEAETAVDEVPGELAHRVHTDLSHATVPKLADHDLLAHDADTDAITLTARGEGLVPYLSLAKTQEPDVVRRLPDRSGDGS